MTIYQSQWLEISYFIVLREEKNKQNKEAIFQSLVGNSFFYFLKNFSSPYILLIALFPSFFLEKTTAFLLEQHEEMIRTLRLERRTISGPDTFVVPFIDAHLLLKKAALKVLKEKIYQHALSLLFWLGMASLFLYAWLYLQKNMNGSFYDNLNAWLLFFKEK